MDGTGPEGKGALTGRQRGKCKSTDAGNRPRLGRGLGAGRGQGRGLRGNAQN